MDNVIRLLAYLIVGAVLLYCNILYIRAVRLTFQPSDYVIMPIKLIGQSDKDGSRGIALAHMLKDHLEIMKAALAMRNISCAHRHLQSHLPATP